MRTDRPKGHPSLVVFQNVSRPCWSGPLHFLVGCHCKSVIGSRKMCGQLWFVQPRPRGSVSKAKCDHSTGRVKHFCRTMSRGGSEPICSVCFDVDRKSLLKLDNTQLTLADLIPTSTRLQRRHHQKQDSSPREKHVQLRLAPTFAKTIRESRIAVMRVLLCRVLVSHPRPLHRSGHVCIMGVLPRPTRLLQSPG